MINPEVIDVDDLPDDPPSDDSEVQFVGFKRDPDKSKHHLEKLNEDGLVYVGYNDVGSTFPNASGRVKSSQPPRQVSQSSSKTPEPHRPSPALPAPRAGPSTNVATVRNKPSGRAQSTASTGPPAKRQKRTHKPSTTNPFLKRDHAAMQAGSVGSTSRHEVICISDSDEEPAPKKPAHSKASTSIPKGETAGRVEEEEEVDYALMHAALDLDCQRNWEDAASKLWTQDEPDGEEEDLALRMAELSVTQSANKRQLHRISGLQRQSNVFDWSDSPHLSRTPHMYYMCQQSVRSTPPRKLTSRWLKDFSPWTNLKRSTPICRAAGDINTIVQSDGIVVVASAVADGAIDDTPGPYNRDGSLVIWANKREFVLHGHSADATSDPVHPRRHHFTVNDVAFDPSCSTRFASAGRDRRLLIWDCERVREGEPPEMVEEIECDDNPERIKYHPDGSTLAVQCDNGSVYLHRDDSISRIAFAPEEDGHVTAEMAWGQRNILFASTACLADGSGRHKAYDIVKGRVVVEFDAGKEACSTLGLCPEGESLFIATEGPNSTFTLRQFDVRRKAAAQKVELEPFVDITDRTAMDINSLSVSADGLYVAAGRTDNWADVYDTRMLAKGPLYSFAHEGVAGPDSFGVVKTQWVDGTPRGVGLVTGGIDGCVRLWDVRRPSDDPLNGTILAQCEYDVATFTLGDSYRDNIPIIVGEKSGQVTIYKRTWEEDDNDAGDDHHGT